MTRDEKVTAFTMLVDGYSYRKIGAYLGYSGSSVFDALRRIVSGGYRKTHFACIYPRIYTWMRDNRMDVPKLAEKMCYTSATLYTYFSGRGEPSNAFRESLVKLTGMAEEELFERESSDVIQIVDKLDNTENGFCGTGR